MILLKSPKLGLHKNSESEAGKVGQHVHEILTPLPIPLKLQPLQLILSFTTMELQ